MKTRHHSSFRISHSAFCILHCALALAVATATASAANDEFVIAENGFAKAAIVVPKDAPKSARYAARQLAKYLDQMTGANVPVADRPLRGYNTIRVGFPHEGASEEIAISVPKRDLAEITGEGPRGPAYAVFDFLETLGCGFWSPDNETVPSETNLVLAAGYRQRLVKLRDLNMDPMELSGLLERDAGEFKAAAQERLSAYLDSIISERQEEVAAAEAKLRAERAREGLMVELREGRTFHELLKQVPMDEEELSQRLLELVEKGAIRAEQKGRSVIYVAV